MKIQIILTLFLFPFNSHGGIFGESNYEECIDSVVSKAKTESATKLGAYNCAMKYSNKDQLIKDCSVTWNGTRFVKGVPENKENYIIVTIENTTHSIYFPKIMSQKVINNIMKDEISNIKLICPLKD